MRNLKKVLALALALVMTLSVMSVASANVEYPDSDSVNPTYAEAVDVLSGMEVFEGDEGGFRPLDTITRAEVTAVIYRIVTGDVTDFQSDIYSGYGNFTDVPADAWYAGYVGFCANGKLVQGDGDGSFRPKDEIIGYEVLAMLLRAIGYDQNGEFSGTGWQVKVATLAQSLGILKNVSVSQLVGPASRELVAELIFQGVAGVPMVTYTALGSYNQYDQLMGGNLNPTLGFLNFGLTNEAGIVVGNQATGEAATLVAWQGWTDKTDELDETTEAPGVYDAGIDTLLTYNVPSYAYANGRSFAIQTGLDLFGHKVNVWYDARYASNRPVYAYYDQATLTATVAASTADIASDNDDKTKTDELFDMAKAAGFAVVATKSEAHWSEVYSQIDADTKAGVDTAAPSTMYVLISNSANKAVDVAITLDIEVALIEKLDTTAKKQSLTLMLSTYGEDDAALSDAHEDHDDDTCASINMASLTPGSVKTLGTTVMATKVVGTATGTPGNDDLPFYDLAAVGTKTATVVAHNKVTNTIQLSDGTTIDVSPLVKADDLDKTQVKSGAVIPLNSDGDAIEWKNAVYTIALDMNGDWLGAVEVGDSTFLYGTYADYATVTNSGTVNYWMTGVNLDGQIVTMPVVYNTVNGVDEGGNPDGTRVVKDLSDGETYTGLTVTKKAWSTNQITVDGVNTGYALSSAGVLDDALPGVGVNEFAADDYFDDAEDTLEIGALNVLAGYVDVFDEQKLFLTNRTKFIVVEGTGTDTLKVKTYNGIAELLGSASGVVIDYANAKYGSMYYTASPYIYNNVTKASEHADVMILDSDAIQYMYASNVYFCDDKDEHGLTSTYTPGGVLTPVTQHWLYNNGVGGWYYLDETYEVDGTKMEAASGTFYNLVQVGTTSTVSKEPIYVLSAAAGNIEGATYNYVGATNNLDTAAFTKDAATVVRTVTGAKVVNLTTDPTMALGSLAELNAAVSYGYEVTVSAVVDGATQAVTAIYVTECELPGGDEPENP